MQSMNTTFEGVGRQWWWLESENAFREFEQDCFAQGYEFLRRIPKLQLEQFFCSQREKSWKQLDRAAQGVFKLTYHQLLDAIGLVKRIFVAPSVIVFNCTLSSDYLLAALRYELACPTPVAAGHNGPEGFVTTGEPRPAVKAADRAMGAEFRDYTKQKRVLWEACPGPGLVKLRLPTKIDRLTKNPRALNTAEIVALFRRFIKDRPRKDFLAYRQRLTRRFRPQRPIQPWVMALGLCGVDPISPSSLAKWLLNSGGAPLLGIKGKQVPNAVRNAKASVQRLVRATLRV